MLDPPNTGRPPSLPVVSCPGKWSPSTIQNAPVQELGASPTVSSILGLAGLLQLVAVLRLLQGAQAARSEGDASSCPAARPPLFPPPRANVVLTRWEQLPPAHRQ